MPKVTGLELARRLRVLRPRLPVIVYSGYIEGLTDEQAKTAGVTAVLRKPVEPAKLRALLKSSLPGRCAV
jgi:CheY-like chemotaxis protein